MTAEGEDTKDMNKPEKIDFSASRDPWDNTSGAKKPVNPWGDDFPEERLLTLKHRDSMKQKDIQPEQIKLERQEVRQPKKKKKSIIIGAVSFLCTIAVIVGAVMFLEHIISSAERAALDAFSAEKDNTAQELREKYYTMGFESAEAANHVSNRVTITIEKLVERRSLEVMTVEDTVYEIMDAKDQSWLKVQGLGVYSVNLMPAEFLVDDVRGYVLVHLPQPEVDVNITQAECLLYKNNKFIDDGNIQKGEDIARDQRTQAMVDLKEDFTTSRAFLEAAREQAKFLIKGLIFGMNPDVPNLTVEVEFYE